MKRSLLMLALLLVGTNVYAQFEDLDDLDYRYEKVQKLYKFRVQLADKKNSPYSVKHPEEFLSQKSIERRKRYGLKVDQHDLPITPAYIDGLKALGLRIHNASKWNNTVVVETADTSVLARVRDLKYVSGVRRVWIGPDSILKMDKVDRHKKITASAEEPDETLGRYGRAKSQAQMLNVHRLHRMGYKGAGITIGILDGGFNNADIIPGLRSVKIFGTKQFVDCGNDVYDEGSHGMMVLSCIAANTPNLFVGTAPEAAFYLIQTEDDRSEQLVEEDNYCAGLEYADSVGCDIVTASLGYTQFDHKDQNDPYAALDGQTALCSKSASLAASRGIIVLNSAGNSGDEAWKKIGFPADARDILAVGAVRSDSVNTGFSSLGYSADGRVKPDVMAQGQACTVYGTNGRLTKANGTSFSCPIMCGAVACLLQACRDKSPVEIMDAVRRSGNNADTPNEIFGYGIPDMQKALDALQKK